MTAQPANHGQGQVQILEYQMTQWLGRAAAVQEDLAVPAAGEETTLPAIGYFWHPTDPGGGAVAEELVRLAVTAGVLVPPPGLNVVLEHRPGRSPHATGTYRVLAELTWAGHDVPLTLCTTPRRWCYIGGGQATGPQAAGQILTEVKCAANSLLARLADCPTAAGSVLVC